MIKRKEKHSLDGAAAKSKMISGKEKACLKSFDKHKKDFNRLYFDFL